MARDCGTQGGYRGGCRCDDCRAANARSSRLFRLQGTSKKSKTPPPPSPRPLRYVDMDDCTITLDQWKELNA